jgi:CubicO group peptidase (beta-lactamase class C family)
MSVDDARHVVVDAIRGGVFPAAAVEVGGSTSVLWNEPFGSLTFDRGAPPTRIDTPFDLASLTKVLATTTVVMELVRTGAVKLSEPVSAFFADWRGADRGSVTIRDLLEHASGLPARLVDAPPATRREFEHDIGGVRLEYPPRTASIYSDLGFILLGFLAADRGAAPLAVQFDRIVARLTTDAAAASGDVPPARHLLRFGLPPDLRTLAAPTRPMDEDRRRGRLLVGEVHDNYASTLGGAAGHAGLFGTATAVGLFARTVLRAARGHAEAPPPFSPALVAEFTTRSSVDHSSRALGWDTMLPTSSCGTRMSPQAFGHVGFTGTSLWIDPPRDRYFVLLANRACAGGTLEDMRAVRRAFHDALGEG